ncbi:uncharacterized protein TRIREDRAFT_57178 [Trichoderma reesei QM6a]|uniref:Predicted protein n=1 Tax=Hypocrea jecorina (strain QM6a) TaxID=431241 RepID=G0RCI1_HYPJQ|nr:uncharacterized protein TRIREDRAFT_57178 [Trichoderma reesei QM6a]EGR51229.1 predicted protein [Trichoderma reesei QM6a]
MDVPFPTDVREFDSDERISFSKLDNKFIAVHDDGTEFEFDAELKKWVPTEEEPLEDELNDLREYSGTPAEGDALHKKRKHDEENGDEKPPPQPKQNTAVYVTGLPADATVEEVHDLFSRKAGVIAEEIDSGKPRIKMYTDAEGNFKGDALIVFFKPESVNMAIMLLDDTEFRFLPNGSTEGRIRVQAADSSYKKTQYDQENTGEASNGNGQKRQRNEKDRQKIIKKTQKLAAKLADWDDDEPYLAPVQPNSKRDRTVILRHMFTLQELEEDPAALLEIKEDIRDECSKLGPVTSVVLYDLEPEGVVSVRFKTAEAAAACIKLMHGRSFGGNIVHATLATGEKFKKSQNETHEHSD